MIEFCGLRKKGVKDWVKHAQSQEHKRNAYEYLKKKSVVK